MKKLLVVIALLVTKVCTGQIGITDSLKYAVAYNYIVNDSIGMTHTIIPSNELTSTSYVWFYEALEFSDNKVIKHLTIEDYKNLPPRLSLSQKQKEKLIRGYKAARFDEFGVETANPNFIFPPSYRLNSKECFNLFFSPIIENEFFVELNNGGFIWGHSYIYFFILNKNNSIKRVYSKFIIYN